MIHSRMQIDPTTNFHFRPAANDEVEALITYHGDASAVISMAPKTLRQFIVQASAYLDTLPEKD